MKYTDGAIQEFMEIYKAEFGKDISREDALEMTTRLINLYVIIYRPLPGGHGDGATPLSGDHPDPDASFQAVE